MTPRGHDPEASRREPGGAGSSASQTFWVSFAAVLAFVLLSFGSDVFATQQNLFNVTRNFAFVAIIALGMTAVIITRRHRPVGRRGARALRHGHRHVDERRHARLVGGAAGARRRLCWSAPSTA